MYNGPFVAAGVNENPRIKSPLPSVPVCYFCGKVMEDDAGWLIKARIVCPDCIPEFIDHYA